MTLPFALETRDQFDALAQQFGLSCAAYNDQFVRYENESVFFIVRFDGGRSYELDVELGQKRRYQPERSFSLAEILRLRGAAEARTIDGMMISDPARLSHALNRLARLALQHASDFLLGSDVSFVQVAKLRERERNAYALEDNLRSARARSDTPWAKRDYQGVVNALEPLESYLSPAEKKRLEYSRKRV